MDSNANKDDEERRRKAEIRSFLNQVAVPLAVKNTNHYATDDELQRCGITRTYLEFSTGRLGRKYEPYIQPIQPDEMEKWLRASGGVDRGDLFDHNSLEPDDFLDEAFRDDPFLDNYSEAEFFYDLIDEYLTRSVEQDDPSSMPSPPVVEANTRWVQVDCDDKYLHRVHEKYKNFSVRAVFRWCGPGNMRRFHWWPDPDTQHINCFLADEVPLADDRLSVAELNTIFVLSGIICLEPRNLLSRRIVPITILSSSKRSVRIVQGTVDFEKRKTEVRVSNIINFDDGIKKKWDQFLTLLGWMAGRPVGRTT